MGYGVRACAWLNPYQVLCFFMVMCLAGSDPKGPAEDALTLYRAVMTNNAA